MLQIVSAWIPVAGATPTYRETNTLSGTPAAAAFVAGLISLYLSEWISNNPTATPDLFPTPSQIINNLWSVNGVLTGVRECRVVDFVDLLRKADYVSGANQLREQLIGWQGLLLWSSCCRVALDSRHNGRVGRGCMLGPRMAVL